MSFSSTVSLFSNKQGIDNIKVDTAYHVDAAVTTEADTVFLIGNGTTFITDGVRAGDTVTMDVSGETATVTLVISDTELYTTVLTGGDTYAGAETFTITSAINGVDIVTGAVAATDPMTYVLIDDNATFISDGVLPGDTVSNATDSQTATVVAVDSETQIRTTVLSAAATYDAADDIDIDDTSNTTFRAVINPSSTGSTVMIRQLMGNSDAAAATDRHCQVFYGNVADSIFDAQMPTGLFGFDPDLKHAEGVPVIVTLEINTEAGSQLNVSYKAVR